MGLSSPFRSGDGAGDDRCREVRQKARRIGQKCDRRDAFEVCDGLRRGIYTSIVYIPEAKVLFDESDIRLGNFKWGLLWWNFEGKL